QVITGFFGPCSRAALPLHGAAFFPLLQEVNSMCKTRNQFHLTQILCAFCVSAVNCSSKGTQHEYNTVDRSRIARGCLLILRWHEVRHVHRGHDEADADAWLVSALHRRV